MKTFSDDSSYLERLVYAEIAKVKSKYKDQLDYEVYENYLVEVGQETYIYDLMVHEKNGRRIFFEFKSGNFSSTSKEMLDKKRQVQSKYQNAEFRLVVVNPDIRKKSQIEIENFGECIELIVIRDKNKIINHYSNFIEIIGIEEYNIIDFHLDKSVLKIKGNSLLKAKFEVKADDLNGTIVDTIPFSFTITLENPKYDILHYPYLIQNLFERKRFKYLMEKSIVNYTIDFYFNDYKN
jgi:hypothetical protein